MTEVISSPANMATYVTNDFQFNLKSSPTGSEKQALDTIQDVEGVPTAETSVPSRTKMEIILLISALSLANLLVALDTTIITTALPVISSYFQSSAGYAWIGSAYILATAVTSPVWAKLSDIWGRKLLLLLSISLFFVGSLLCGLAVSMVMLIVSRAVQGLGGGGLSILVTICISDAFSMRERPIYFGFIGMTWAFASAIGPLMGGIITTKASWKWCFFINLPCTAVCFLVVWFKLDVHAPKTPLWKGLEAVDWLGIIAMIAAAALLLMGLQMGGVYYPWSSPIIVTFISFGIVLSGLFVIVEWKFAKYPLMPLRIFRSRNSLAPLGVACFHSMTVIGGSYFLPLYFQGVLSASPLMSGVFLLPLTLSLSITSALTGFVVRGTGSYLMTMRVSTLLMALGLGLFIDLPSNYNWTKIIIYQLLLGFGVGPNFQGPLIALQATIPQADHAAASSTFNFFRNLSASVAIVASTAIFQNLMQSQHDALVVRLGSKVESLFTGNNAASNVEVIHGLSGPERAFAQKIFLKGMLGIWIMLVVFGFGAFACSMYVKDTVLSKEHKATETGLEAEESKRILEENRRKSSKEMKISKK